MKAVTTSAAPTTDPFEKTKIAESVDHIARSVIRRTEVLARLFELLAAQEMEGALSVEWGGEREEHFWDGLRALAVQTIGDQERIMLAIDGLYHADDQR